MLSYRHAFHAGNFADVLKHLVLCKSLQYMIQKDTPVVYIDTHAGAGIYSLNNKLATKTDEFKSGIGALNFSSLPEAIQLYNDCVTPLLKKQQYPGSPWLAAQILRPKDKLWLYEMHSSDYPLLDNLFNQDKRVRTSNSDGYHSLKALLPTKNARALILIDPSYELKTDFKEVVEGIQQAHKRMASAQILLWYPIVDRKQTEKMIKKICTSGIRDIWRYELCMQADTQQYGMTGSGILAINPPWVLADQMRELLPAIAGQLVTDTGYYKVEQLVAE